MEDDIFKGVNVLIAEDDTLNYMLLEELLCPTGMKPIWAKNGLEALDILAMHKNISLILMDVNMPVMDGIEATQKIRENGIDTPIIFLTAYLSAEMERECCSVGGNEFLSKPLRWDKLSSLLEKYLKKSTTSIMLA